VRRSLPKAAGRFEAVFEDQTDLLKYMLEGTPRPAFEPPEQNP